METRLRLFDTISVLPFLLLLLVAGCSPRFDPPPRPAAVSHMDISQKKAYLDQTRSTLKIFHAAALDLNHRGDYQSRYEVADKAENFIRTHVKPIVDDFEAGNSLETQTGVAELQLLSGMIYLELKRFPEARLQLREMERRYEKRREILNAALDLNEFGFRDLDEGIRSLRERLYGIEEDPSPSHLF